MFHLAPTWVTRPIPELILTVMDVPVVVFKVQQDMVPQVVQGLVKPPPLVLRRRRTRHTVPAC